MWDDGGESGSARGNILEIEEILAICQDSQAANTEGCETNLHMIFRKNFHSEIASTGNIRT